MSIRRQILLLLMPLYFGLAVVGAGVLAGLQLRTAFREFEVELKTVATVVAEYADVASLQAIKAGESWTETRLHATMLRMRRWDQLARLVVLTSEGRILADTLPGEEFDRSLPAPQQREPVTRLPWLGRADNARRTATAVIETRVAGLWIGVEVSMDGYLDRVTQIQADAIRLGSIVLLVGVAVSLGLAAFISWQFRLLERAAARIGSPGFELETQPTRILEVEDVGSVLGVMHSVLRETQDKLRRSHQDHEYVRSDQTLARTLRERTAAAGIWSAAGASGVSIPVGSGAILHGTMELTARNGAAYAGLMPAGADFVATLRVRAAEAYLRSVLDRPDWADGVAATARLFGLSQLAVARWTPTGAEGIHFNQGTISPLPASATGIVLACLTPENLRRLNTYLASVPAATEECLLADLPAVLADGTCGVVVSVRLR